MIDELIETLKNLNEKQAAFQLLAALGRHAVTFEQLDIVARNMFKIKKYKEALPIAEKCLELSETPNHNFNARLNLVNVLAHAYQPERALEEIEILEQTAPNDKDVRLKKAYALFLVGRRDEAEVILREELVNPANDEKTRNDIEFNLGTYEMYKDNFYEGLYRFLIHGRKMNLWNKPRLPFTEFELGMKPQPEHLIVIRAEAGIGDEFINIRFMKHFQDLGMIPVWYTDREEMRDLFNRHGYTAVSSVEEVKDHWNGKDIYWCHSMDIPVLLNLEYKDLWYGPYLFAKSDIVPKVKASKELRIGLRWQGNPEYDNDLHRSIPLTEMYAAVSNAAPKAKLYSLQRDHGVGELHDIDGMQWDEFFFDGPITALHETSLQTYEQTLAEIAALDVVVTSCTSIAHASAAMGKKTFVLTPMSSYYTWCHSMKQSPWYGDNLTIIRQQRPRYWDEPLAELKEHLSAIQRNHAEKNT